MNDQERKQMIEEFMKTNQGDKEKVVVVDSSGYERRQKALDEGRAVLLWNGSKWEYTPISINSSKKE